MKVALHKVKDDIDVLEISSVTFRFEDVSNGDDIVVFEVLQDFYFAIRSLCNHFMIEDVRNFFYGNLSKKLFTFRSKSMFIEKDLTLSLDFELIAEHTTPYAPEPIVSTASYGVSTKSNLISNVLLVIVCLFFKGWVIYEIYKAKP